MVFDRRLLKSRGWSAMSRSQSVAKLAIILLSFPYALQARQHFSGVFFSTVLQPKQKVEVGHESCFSQ